MRIFGKWAGSLVIVCCLLLASSSSWGQQGGGGASGGGNAAGFEFGQVWPAGKIGENVNSTIAPGIFYEYAASQIFAMQVNLIRSSHNDKLSIFSTSTGIKANLFFYDQLVPYAFAGVGLYFIHKKVGLTEEEVSSTNFGVNLGVGADLNLGSTFFTGLYLGLHNLFSAQATTSTGTTDISGRWSAFFIRAGMRF